MISLNSFQNLNCHLRLQSQTPTRVVIVIRRECGSDFIRITYYTLYVTRKKLLCPRQRGGGGVCQQFLHVTWMQTHAHTHTNTDCQTIIMIYFQRIRRYVRLPSRFLSPLLSSLLLLVFLLPYYLWSNQKVKLVSPHRID